MCDIAHALLMERAERIALALLTGAAVNGAADDPSFDVNRRLAEFDAWLCSEPGGESADDARMRELMEEVA